VHRKTVIMSRAVRALWQAVSPTACRV